MKLTVILLTVLIPLSAFSDTNIVITPDRPGLACSDVGLTGFINRIFNLNTSENEKELYISFSTEYYQTCQNNKPNLLEITNGYYFDFWREGRNWPWTLSPFEDEDFHLENSKTLHVSLVFNKLKKFKKTDKVTIQFQFTPNNFDHRGMAFDWRMTLEKIDQHKTKLRFH